MIASRPTHLSNFSNQPPLRDKLPAFLDFFSLLRAHRPAYCMPPGSPTADTVDSHSPAPRPVVAMPRHTPRPAAPTAPASEPSTPLPGDAPWPGSARHRDPVAPRRRMRRTTTSGPNTSPRRRPSRSRLAPPASTARSGRLASRTCGGAARNKRTSGVVAARPCPGLRSRHGSKSASSLRVLPMLVMALVRRAQGQAGDQVERASLWRGEKLDLTELSADPRFVAPLRPPLAKGGRRRKASVGGGRSGWAQGAATPFENPPHRRSAPAPPSQGGDEFGLVRRNNR